MKKELLEQAAHFMNDSEKRLTEERAKVCIELAEAVMQSPTMLQLLTQQLIREASGRSDVMSLYAFTTACIEVGRQLHQLELLDEMTTPEDNRAK